MQAIRDEEGKTPLFIAENTLYWCGGLGAGDRASARPSERLARFLAPASPDVKCDLERRQFTSFTRRHALQPPRSYANTINAAAAVAGVAHAHLRSYAVFYRLLGSHQSSAAVDSSDNSSVHTTPSLRGRSFPGTKTDVDSHFDLEASQATSSGVERQNEDQSPPPFSSHNFPSRYFPAPSPTDPYRALVTECATESLTALAPPQPSVPAPPFEESAGSTSSVVAETKAALPRDTKDGQSSKDLDDGEPPPPYTEGSSPLEGFTYVMAAAGSIITQVQQGGPAPINTALGGGKAIPNFVSTSPLRKCRILRREHHARASVRFSFRPT